MKTGDVVDRLYAMCREAGCSDEQTLKEIMVLASELLRKNSPTREVAIENLGAFITCLMGATLDNDAW